MARGIEISRREDGSYPQQIPDLVTVQQTRCVLHVAGRSQRDPPLYQEILTSTKRQTYVNSDYFNPDVAPQPKQVELGRWRQIKPEQLSPSVPRFDMIDTESEVMPLNARTITLQNQSRSPIVKTTVREPVVESVLRQPPTIGLIRSPRAAVVTMSPPKMTPQFRCKQNSVPLSRRANQEKPKFEIADACNQFKSWCSAIAGSDDTSPAPSSHERSISSEIEDLTSDSRPRTKGAATRFANALTHFSDHPLTQDPGHSLTHLSLPEPKKTYGPPSGRKHMDRETSTTTPRTSPHTAAGGSTGNQMALETTDNNYRGQTRRLKTDSWSHAVNTLPFDPPLRDASQAFEVLVPCQPPGRKHWLHFHKSSAVPPEDPGTSIATAASAPPNSSTAPTSPRTTEPTVHNTEAPYKTLPPGALHWKMFSPATRFPRSSTSLSQTQQNAPPQGYEIPAEIGPHSLTQPNRGIAEPDQQPPTPHLNAHKESHPARLPMPLTKAQLLYPLAAHLESKTNIITEQNTSLTNNISKPLPELLTHVGAPELAIFSGGLRSSDTDSELLSSCPEDILPATDHLSETTWPNDHIASDTESLLLSMKRINESCPDKCSSRWSVPSVATLSSRSKYEDDHASISDHEENSRDYISKKSTSSVHNSQQPLDIPSSEVQSRSSFDWDDWELVEPNDVCAPALDDSAHDDNPPEVKSPESSRIKVTSGNSVEDKPFVKAESIDIVQKSSSSDDSASQSSAKVPEGAQADRDSNVQNITPSSTDDLQENKDSSLEDPMCPLNIDVSESPDNAEPTPLTESIEPIETKTDNNSLIETSGIKPEQEPPPPLDELEPEIMTIDSRADESTGDPLTSAEPIVMSGEPTESLIKDDYLDRPINQNSSTRRKPFGIKKIWRDLFGGRTTAAPDPKLSEAQLRTEVNSEKSASASPTAVPAESDEIEAPETASMSGPGEQITGSDPKKSENNPASDVSSDQTPTADAAQAAQILEGQSTQIPELHRELTSDSTGEAVPPVEEEQIRTITDADTTSSQAGSIKSARATSLAPDVDFLLAGTTSSGDEFTAQEPVGEPLPVKVFVGEEDYFDFGTAPETSVPYDRLELGTSASPVRYSSTDGCTMSDEDLDRFPDLPSAERHDEHAERELSLVEEGEGDLPQEEREYVTEETRTSVSNNPDLAQVHIASDPNLRSAADLSSFTTNTPHLKEPTDDETAEVRKPPSPSLHSDHNLIGSTTIDLMNIVNSPQYKNETEAEIFKKSLTPLSTPRPMFISRSQESLLSDRVSPIQPGDSEFLTVDATDDNNRAPTSTTQTIDSAIPFAMTTSEYQSLQPSEDILLAVLADLTPIRPCHESSSELPLSSSDPLATGTLDVTAPSLQPAEDIRCGLGPLETATPEDFIEGPSDIDLASVKPATSLKLSPDESISLSISPLYDAQYSGHDSRRASSFHSTEELYPNLEGAAHRVLARGSQHESTDPLQQAEDHSLFDPSLSESSAEDGVSNTQLWRIFTMAHHDLCQSRNDDAHELSSGTDSVLGKTRAHSEIILKQHTIDPLGEKQSGADTDSKDFEDHYFTLDFEDNTTPDSQTNEIEEQIELNGSLPNTTVVEDADILEPEKASNPQVALTIEPLRQPLSDLAEHYVPVGTGLNNQDNKPAIDIDSLNEIDHISSQGELAEDEHKGLEQPITIIKLDPEPESQTVPQSAPTVFFDEYCESPPRPPIPIATWLRTLSGNSVETPGDDERTDNYATSDSNISNYEGTDSTSGETNTLPSNSSVSVYSSAEVDHNQYRSLRSSVSAPGLRSATSKLSLTDDSSESASETFIPLEKLTDAITGTDESDQAEPDSMQPSSNQFATIEPESVENQPAPVTDNQPVEIIPAPPTSQSPISTDQDNDEDSNAPEPIPTDPESLGQYSSVDTANATLDESISEHQPFVMSFLSASTGAKSSPKEVHEDESHEVRSHKVDVPPTTSSDHITATLNPKGDDTLTCNVQLEVDPIISSNAADSKSDHSTPASEISDEADPFANETANPTQNLVHGELNEVRPSVQNAKGYSESPGEEIQSSGIIDPNLSNGTLTAELPRLKGDHYESLASKSMQSAHSQKTSAIDSFEPNPSDLYHKPKLLNDQLSELLAESDTKHDGSSHLGTSNEISSLDINAAQPDQIHEIEIRPFDHRFGDQFSVEEFLSDEPIIEDLGTQLLQRLRVMTESPTSSDFVSPLATESEFHSPQALDTKDLFRIISPSEQPNEPQTRPFDIMNLLNRAMGASSANANSANPTNVHGSTHTSAESINGSSNVPDLDVQQLDQDLPEMIDNLVIPNFKGKADEPADDEEDQKPSTAAVEIREDWNLVRMVSQLTEDSHSKPSIPQGNNANEPPEDNQGAALYNMNLPPNLSITIVEEISPELEVRAAVADELFEPDIDSIESIGNLSSKNSDPDHLVVVNQSNDPIYASLSPMSLPERTLLRHRAPSGSLTRLGHTELFERSRSVTEAAMSPSEAPRTPVSLNCESKGLDAQLWAPERADATPSDSDGEESSFFLSSSEDSSGEGFARYSQPAPVGADVTPAQNDRVCEAREDPLESARRKEDSKIQQALLNYLSAEEPNIDAEDSNLQCSRIMDESGEPQNTDLGGQESSGEAVSNKSTSGSRTDSYIGRAFQANLEEQSLTAGFLECGIPDSFLAPLESLLDLGSVDEKVIPRGKGSQVLGSSPGTDTPDQGGSQSFGANTRVPETPPMMHNQTSQTPLRHTTEDKLNRARGHPHALGYSPRGRVIMRHGNRAMQFLHGPLARSRAMTPPYKTLSKNKFLQPRTECEKSESIKASNSSDFIPAQAGSSELKLPPMKLPTEIEDISPPAKLRTSCEKATSTASPVAEDEPAKWQLNCAATQTEDEFLQPIIADPMDWITKESFLDSAEPKGISSMPPEDLQPAIDWARSRHGGDFPSSCIDIPEPRHHGPPARLASIATPLSHSTEMIDLAASQSNTSSRFDEQSNPQKLAGTQSDGDKSVSRRRKVSSQVEPAPEERNNRWLAPVNRLVCVVESEVAYSGEIGPADAEEGSEAPPQHGGAAIVALGSETDLPFVRAGRRSHLVVSEAVTECVFKPAQHRKAFVCGGVVGGIDSTGACTRFVNVTYK